MPRKYEGEPERDPKEVAAEKGVKAALGAAGLGVALGGAARAGKRLGKAAAGAGRKRKRKTFKYKPWI